MSSKYARRCGSGDQRSRKRSVAALAELRAEAGFDAQRLHRLEQLAVRAVDEAAAALAHDLRQAAEVAHDRRSVFCANASIVVIPNVS